MQTLSFMESEDSTLTKKVEENIEIISKLKKEQLSFNPGQLLYATSDGNYVLFYLNRNNKIEKEIIRNSISDIEQQLSHIPYFMRTHRAFIVNVKEVRMQKGNTLGYRLKLFGIDTEIPVSRSYTQPFNQLFTQYH
jgi:DNA-binding LytR/AlgR family response regulator